MRRIIWNIVTVLAIINLIWLFVFNYKIPRIPSFSFGKQEEPAGEEDVVKEDTDFEEQNEENQESENADLTEQNQEDVQQSETETAENLEGNAQEDMETEEGLIQCRINDGYNARIRSGPGTDYEIVTEMESGSILAITGEMENGWYPIRTDDGTEGYIYGELVTIVEPEE